MERLKWNWDRFRQIRKAELKLVPLTRQVLFINAVHNVNFVLIKRCLDEGVDPNSHTGDYFTPLHRAVEKANFKLAELLLKYPATDVNRMTMFGMTALNMACRFSLKEIIELLLQHGADVHIYDKFECTPLHSATMWGHEAIVRLLLEYGAKPNVINAFGISPLYIAINEAPNEAIAELLIEFDADVNFFHSNCTMTLLMECCLFCQTSTQLNMIALLIRRGVLINAKAHKSNRTALHIAAFTGNVELIKLLLEGQANPNVVDLRGDRPYDVAMRHGNYRAALLLQIDEEGEYPLK